MTQEKECKKILQEIKDKEDSAARLQQEILNLRKELQQKCDHEHTIKTEGSILNGSSKYSYEDVSCSICGYRIYRHEMATEKDLLMNTS